MTPRQLEESRMKDHLVYFFAQSETTSPLPVAPGTPRESILSREVPMILCLAAALAAVLLLWAVFVRRRRHPDPHVRALQPGLPPGTEDSDSGHHRHRHRRHHRKRTHELKRNPTLHETGGLPPLRPDDEAPKF